MIVGILLLLSPMLPVIGYESGGGQLWLRFGSFRFPADAGAEQVAVGDGIQALHQLEAAALSLGEGILPDGDAGLCRSSATSPAAANCGCASAASASSPASWPRSSS